VHRRLRSPTLFFLGLVRFVGEKPVRRRGRALVAPANCLPSSSLDDSWTASSRVLVREHPKEALKPVSNESTPRCDGHPPFDESSHLEHVGRS